MKNARRKDEDFAKFKNLNIEEFEKMNNLQNEEKLKLKIFNFCWWRDPPYKNDDFRRRIQLS